MLQSTVSTGSYSLQKYSRSYPSSTSSQTQSQNQVAGQSEWQHFTNPPVLTLTLYVKKSADNKLFESVRLRIIWNLDDGAQREIMMEDLDLLSFSGLDYQVHSSQGLPLKAVYRGPDVGIRYQHPLTVPATSPSSYRRFQVNFVSVSDAAQFIDAIRPVCPCKENAGPPLPLPTPRMPTDNRRPAVPRSASVIPASSASASAPLARHHTVVGPQRPSMPPLPPSAAGTTTTAIENAHHNYRSGRAADGSQERPSQKPLASGFPPSSSSELSLAPLSSSSSDPAAPISGLDTSSRPWSALPEMPSSQFATAQSTLHSSGSSLPPSQPAPTASTLAPTPPPSLSQGKPPEAVLGNLRGASELYSLTLPELENLVSVIVHEPGFPKLLEKLDSMWVTQGFLGRQFTTAQRKDPSGGSSLPPLSQPTPPASTLAPTPPSSLSQGKTPEAILEYLREASELYSLTGPGLENLLSVVVREPGFPKLLEKLDSMWVIQGPIQVKG